LIGRKTFEREQQSTPAVASAGEAAAASSGEAPVESAAAAAVSRNTKLLVRNP